MTFPQKSQAVKLFKNGEQFLTDLFIPPKYHFSRLNFEFLRKPNLHFVRPAHIICP